MAIKLTAREQLIYTGGSLIMWIGVIVAVWRGAQAHTLGDVAVLFQAAQGAYGQIQQLGSLLQALTAQSGFAAELRSFLQQPQVFPDPNPDAAQPSPQVAPAFTQRALSVAFRNVTFTYPGCSEPVLHNITFDIEPGEVVALVGENAAGKTTLVRLLLGLYPPDCGQVLLDGRDIHTIPPEERYRMAAGIFQFIVRYPWTLQQNVLVDRKSVPSSEGRYRHSVASVGLDTVIGRLVEGDTALLGPDIGGVDLSGGEWQRVALARALYRGSGLLVLDEPTAALDPLAELSFLESFVRAAQGRTLILVSHRLGVARLADRILVLAGGRLVENGRHDELMRANNVYAKMFEAQARWYR